MIGSITVLLLLQLAGAIIVRVTGMPLPGPVLGMLLLFVYLAWRGGASERFEHTARSLLAHLALLFVPAGVGIITHLHAVAAQWLALTLTLILSTAATIVVTGFVLRALMSSD